LSGFRFDVTIPALCTKRNSKSNKKTHCNPLSLRLRQKLPHTHPENGSQEGIQIGIYFPAAIIPAVDRRPWKFFSFYPATPLVDPLDQIRDPPPAFFA
jgi:hypothetical protein